MAELKTQRTTTTVEDYISDIADEERRQDCLTLLDVMKRATGADPAVWSSGAVGFGTYHYKSSSGQEGDWYPVGFASRKAAITIYLGLELDDLTDWLAKLGKHTTGKGCIYVKRLAVVDLEVLEKLVADAYARMMKTYG